MRRVALEVPAQVGIRRVRSDDQRVVGLAAGRRQSLAIIRAVYFGARVLLLDEPAAALSVRETSRVFAMIGAAKEAGHGVLYIDHNIGHLHGIVDRVLVLERGRVVDDFAKEDTTVGQLVEMLGAAGELDAAESMAVQ